MQNDKAKEELDDLRIGLLKTQLEMEAMREAIEDVLSPDAGTAFTLKYKHNLATRFNAYANKIEQHNPALVARFVEGYNPFINLGED